MLMGSLILASKAIRQVERDKWSDGELLPDMEQLLVVMWRYLTHTIWLRNTLTSMVRFSKLCSEDEEATFRFGLWW